MELSLTPQGFFAVMALMVLLANVNREEDLLIPERRRWLGWLRRLSPRARRQSEARGGREAEEFVRELTGPLPPVTMAEASESLTRYGGLVGEACFPPRELIPPITEQVRPERLDADSRLAAEGQFPPWEDAPVPESAGEELLPASPETPGPLTAPEPATGTPTVVTRVVRPVLETDLGPYLLELSQYPDDPGQDAYLRGIPAEGA